MRGQRSSDNTCDRRKCFFSKNKEIKLHFLGEIWARLQPSSARCSCGSWSQAHRPGRLHGRNRPQSPLEQDRECKYLGEFLSSIFSSIFIYNYEKQHPFSPVLVVFQPMILRVKFGFILTWIKRRTEPIVSLFQVWKRKAEQYLADSGIPYTIIRYG